jgi:hypothetical protein
MDTFLKKFRDFLFLTFSIIIFQIGANMTEANERKLGRVKLLKDFAPLHEKLSDANNADDHNAFVALMDQTDFDTDYYSYRKELYTLILSETVFIHIVNGITENGLLEKYLKKIKNNSEIIRDSINDPSYVIMLHLLKSAYFSQKGKIKESLNELAIFKTITSKFKGKEDIQYAAAMKDLIAKGNTPEVIKTFKKRAVILFNQQFAYVKQGIEQTEIIKKHSKGN